MLNDEKSWAVVTAINVEAALLTAYNMKVSAYHTYFVTGDTGANPVWVHNDCNVPRNARDLSGGPLENATRTRGLFDVENGPPNGVLYRADNQGNITSYIVYDANGQALRRVDVRGAPHRGVPTPHVVEYTRNRLPDGTVRVNSNTRLPPRPITPDEVP